jgi:hypothetical protein
LEQNCGHKPDDLLKEGTRMERASVDEGFRRIEGVLREHAELAKAGHEMVEAFVEMARGVWKVCPTLEVKPVGKWLPFKLPGKPHAVDVPQVQKTGAIELALRKRFPGGTRGVRPLREKWKKFRFGGYACETTFEDPRDGNWLRDLVVQCLDESQGGAIPSLTAEGEAPASEQLRFMRRERLRQVLNDDWRDAGRALEAGLWKSCVVLCGGILEGILVDVLDRDERRGQVLEMLRRRRERSGNLSNRADKVEDYDLAALIDVARSLDPKVLSAPLAKQCDVLRTVRNLVHPVAQVREDLHVTAAQARIALDTVKQCADELRRRFATDKVR